MSRYPAVLTALFLSLTAVAAPAWARAPTVPPAAT
ncbi:MAG TPA: alpha/beta hydrolase, partial [Brevundimonas sp.]|nr:alpha/beta hydrolase [Brevundimonas sp.]